MKIQKFTAMLYQIFATIVVLVMITMIGCTVSGSFDSRPTPTPVGYGLGNGVFVKDRLTHKRGLITGTSCYDDEKWITLQDCVYTVKFEDGTIEKKKQKFELELNQ